MIVLEYPRALEPSPSSHLRVPITDQRALAAHLLRALLARAGCSWRTRPALMGGAGLRDADRERRRWLAA